VLGDRLLVSGILGSGILGSHLLELGRVLPILELSRVLGFLCLTPRKEASHFLERRRGSWPVSRDTDKFF